MYILLIKSSNRKYMSEGWSYPEINTLLLTSIKLFAGYSEGFQHKIVYCLLCPVCHEMNLTIPSRVYSVCLIRLLI